MARTSLLKINFPSPSDLKVIHHVRAPKGDTFPEKNKGGDEVEEKAQSPSENQKKSPVRIYWSGAYRPLKFQVKELKEKFKELSWSTRAGSSDSRSS